MLGKKDVYGHAVFKNDPSFFPSLPPFFLSLSFLCSLLSSIYRIGDLSHGLPLATELCLQTPKGITSEVTAMAQIWKSYGWTIMQPIQIYNQEIIEIY